MRPSHISGLLPRSSRASIVLFWARYWALFFLLLPIMLVMQLADMLVQTTSLACTWNRRYELFGGALRLVFLNSWRPLLASMIWGERFLMIDYRGLLVDPGPTCTRRAVDRYLTKFGGRVRAVVVTHEHEEHIGNAAYVSRITGAPVLGSRRVLRAFRNPEQLSLPRRTFIGQPEAMMPRYSRELARSIVVDSRRLVVIDSPGHCAGHVSIYDPQKKLLIAGDSFLHTYFTAPNRDVRSDDWVRTLEAYRKLDIRTMIGGHGCVYTSDPLIQSIPFVVRKCDPNALIRRKLAFLRLERRVIALGERRRLPYSVIEACAFPWSAPWTWRNWFKDEAIRLFSAGEFSRTYFVRSLTLRPGRVPPRFPTMVRLVDRWRTATARAAA